MKKANSHNIDSTSQIPLDIQAQLCREIALAFRHLCRTVCKTFGHEGEKVVKEIFLSDSNLSVRNLLHDEEIPSKELGGALIKLLASWGISSGSGTQ